MLHKKITIKHPDGTVEELEGDQHEIDEYLKKREKSAQVKEGKTKKQILTDEIRRVVAEELDKRPYPVCLQPHCHHPWWWTLTYPPVVQPQPLSPWYTITTNDQTLPLQNRDNQFTVNNPDVISSVFKDDPDIELGKKLPDVQFLTGMSQLKDPGAVVTGGPNVCAGGPGINRGGQVWTGVLNTPEHLASAYDLNRKIKS